MEGNRVELYGFQTVIKPTGLRVYSANNSILRDMEAHLKNIGNYKVLAIKADHKVRVERLHKRSPDLELEEIEYRLSDNGEDVIKKSDYLIDNSHLALEEIAVQSQTIIDSLLN